MKVSRETVAGLVNDPSEALAPFVEGLVDPIDVPEEPVDRQVREVDQEGTHRGDRQGAE